ncbi:MAG: nucleotidyltransferase family protein [Edaphobacter sp.]
MTRLSSRVLARQAEAHHQPMPSIARSAPISATATYRPDADRTIKRLSREQRLHEAVLLSFSETVVSHIELLLPHISPAEWRRLLNWLDASGLALYFLDRLSQLELRDALPKTAIERLQQNLHNNAKRTRGMIEESVAIQRDFQAAGLSYAVVKGLSLSPGSVPRPELRHQFDLDYLVAEKSAPEARSILERRGYRLRAFKRKTWEFKINETPYVSVKDLYKDLPYRSVELHLEAEADTHGQDSRLDRTTTRKMFGINMPVLSPVDIFRGQAMHLFKDVCCGTSRTAHLLEFYRHVLSRRDDDAFWRELRAQAEGDRGTCIGMGVATYLVTSIMGDFAPDALTVWTAEVLPPSVRLWVDRYGRHTIFGNHPGTKFYLLLQKELERARISGGTVVKKALWPSRLPPVVIRGSSGEPFSTRIARYRVQVRFVFERFRFHLVEGVRYTLESYRWRQHLDRLSS